MALFNKALRTLASKELPESLRHIPVRVMGKPAPRIVSRAIDELGVLARDYPEIAKRQLKGGMTIFDDAGASNLKGIHKSTYNKTSSDAWYLGSERSMHVNASNLVEPMKGSTFFSVSSRASSLEDRIGRTVSHEFGHAIHEDVLDRLHGAARKALPEDDAAAAISQHLSEGLQGRTLGDLIPSEYAKMNPYEEFAETFVHQRYEIPAMNAQEKVLPRFNALIDSNIDRNKAEFIQDAYKHKTNTGKTAASRRTAFPSMRRTPSSGRMGGVPTRSRTQSRAHNRKSF